MLRDIALVAVDLDGTLLTGQGRLAVEGAQMLSHAAGQGVRVVPATARNPESTRLFCQQLGVRDPLICANGARVWASPDGPTWAEWLIPQEAALELACLADANDWELSVTVGELTYWRQRPGQPLGPLSATRMVVRTNAEMVVGCPVRILAGQPEAIAGLRALCEQRFNQECRAETFLDPAGQPSSLAIFPSQADKGSALRLVLERLGIDPRQVMAIGDNLIDLPMFAVARLSVAMGNAPEAVKRRATVVAPGNDEEGVAWAIRGFLL
jgi:hydroxymethylpyrimidine pyrophosphatase-like HAD family hydrolase